MKVITNRVPRKMIYGYELTDKEKREFNYIALDEFDSHDFFRYKGQVYDFSEFLTTQNIPEFRDNWHGYTSDTYFSGILVKLCDQEPYWDNESIIVGMYYSG